MFLTAVSRPSQSWITGLCSEAHITSGARWTTMCRRERPGRSASVTPASVTFLHRSRNTRIILRAHHDIRSYLSGYISFSDNSRPPGPLSCQDSNLQPARILQSYIRLPAFCQLCGPLSPRLRLPRHILPCNGSPLAGANRGDFMRKFRFKPSCPMVGCNGMYLLARRSEISPYRRPSVSEDPSSSLSTSCIRHTWIVARSCSSHRSNSRRTLRP